MDEDLWTSIRNPDTFFEVGSDSLIERRVENHFFQKADAAMEKLSELVWEPIVRECLELKHFLDDDCPSAKPVSGGLLFLSDAAAAVPESLMCEFYHVYRGVYGCRSTFYLT